MYGLVLTVLGIGFTTDAEIDRSAGVNINLWAGIGLLVLRLLFVVWARPLRVPATRSEETPPAAPQ